jgi:hypothetical protein
MREVFLDPRLRGDDVLSSYLKKIVNSHLSVLNKSQMWEVLLDPRLRGDDVWSLCSKKICYPSAFLAKRMTFGVCAQKKTCQLLAFRTKE